MTKLCHEIESNLSAYLFDELEPDMKEQVGAHLRECGACQNEMESLRGTVAALDQEFRKHPVPAALAEARVEVIRREAEPTTSGQAVPRAARIVRLKRWRRGLIGLAAASVVAVPIYLTWEQSSPVAPFIYDIGLSGEAPEKVNLKRLNAALEALKKKDWSFFPKNSRAQIEKVKADQKSLATGIDSYYVDSNQYPTVDSGSQVPAKSLDVALSQAPAPLAGSALTGGDNRKRNDYYRLNELGTYDPSNGSTSNGDVFRVKDGQAAGPAENRPAKEQNVAFYETYSFAEPKSENRLENLGYLGNKSFNVADADESLIEEHLQRPGPGTAPNAMYFKDYGVNPFIETAADKLSTFAIDVDTASCTITRNYINQGALPPFPAVRVEEIVNYFPNHYAAPEGADFKVYGAMTPSPFGRGFHLLRIGIKGREITSEQRKPLVLTFVIDVSGSMNREDRLGLVKRTLQTLASQLKQGDKIGIAVYGTNGRELLAHTPVTQSASILTAINGLAAEGSTNAGEGLQIGYAMARRAFDSSAVNRVILCSDGVANNGVTHPDAILGEIAGYAKDNIYLTAIGVGMGNYNDVLMEQLADKGNGTYAYLDSDQEAQRFLQKDLLGGMEVIAQDVKIQVEFDPAAVKQYRLMGFENRDVADKDFRNDAVDAGEIGAGHSVTALYELELAPGSEEEGVATVFVRYKKPDQEMKVKEIKGTLKRAAIQKPFESADEHFKVIAIAAEYAEILRNSYWARGSSMKEAGALFDSCFPGNPPGPEAAELRGLIDAAERLTQNRPAPVKPIQRETPAPGGGDEPPNIPIEEERVN